ncbi:hypothetical protein GWI33_003921, partial [Rhynchophorus ferrugineus]
SEKRNSRRRNEIRRWAPNAQYPKEKEAHTNESPREENKVNRADCIMTPAIHQEKTNPLLRPWLTPTPSTSEAAKPANFKTLKPPVPKPSAETTESTVNIPAYHANEPPREVTKVNRALTATDDFTINPPRKNQLLSKLWLNPTPSTSEEAKSANSKTPKKLVPKTSAEATESTEIIRQTPITKSNATTSTQPPSPRQSK